MDTLSGQQQRTAETAALISTKFFTFEQLTRLLLKISADFCAVDLFGNGFLRPSARPKTTAAEAGPKRPPQTWVLLVRGLYFYTTARILIYVGLQYIYDFDWREYERLLQESGFHPATATTNSSYRNPTATARTGTINNTTSAPMQQQQLLEQRIERDIERLKFVGAPFIKFHFGVELVYIFGAWTAFVLYLLPQLYFRYVRPFDFSLLQAVVDLNREQLRCDKMVRREVNKFCTSNRLFVQSFSQWSSSRRPDFAGLNFDQLLANLKHTTEQLNRMTRNGSLRPIDRSSAWIKRTSRQMGYLCFCVLSGHLVLIVWLFVYLPQSQFLGMSGIETGAMDLLSFVETLILAAIETISVNFYLTATAFNTLDQIRTVKELNRLIECCICSNTQTFRRVQASSIERYVSFSPSDSNTKATSATQLESASIVTSTRLPEGDADEEAFAQKVRQCQTQMNYNLLFVVMNYKIFVGQTKSTLGLNAFTMLLTVKIMIIGPVISLFSVQYLTTGMLYAMVGCCLAVIVLGDISMAPRCYFSSYHHRTYRSLHSLLAHAVAVSRAFVATSATVDLYDGHAILVLRKELSDPDQLIKQFTTTLLGFQFNMSNLLKIHFWCGILAILSYYAYSGPNKRSLFEATFKFL